MKKYELSFNAQPYTTQREDLQSTQSKQLTKKFKLGHWQPKLIIEAHFV